MAGAGVVFNCSTTREAKAPMFTPPECNAAQIRSRRRKRTSWSMYGSSLYQSLRGNVVRICTEDRRLVAAESDLVFVGVPQVVAAAGQDQRVEAFDRLNIVLAGHDVADHLVNVFLGLAGHAQHQVGRRENARGPAIAEVLDDHGNGVSFPLQPERVLGPGIDAEPQVGEPGLVEMPEVRRRVLLVDAEWPTSWTFNPRRRISVQSSYRPGDCR